ncbi:MAG: hypothetical protein NVSMB38_01440 [Ktedonobacteraceae bacterium]
MLYYCGSIAQTPTPRLKTVMTSLITRVHAFIREVEAFCCDKEKYHLSLIGALTTCIIMDPFVMKHHAPQAHHSA